MNESEKLKSYIKNLRGLITGIPKKNRNPNDKPALLVTSGDWSTPDNDIMIAGIDTDDSYVITWKNKNHVAINKEQAKINFSYVSSLNPVVVLKLLDEIERLQKLEK